MNIINVLPLPAYSEGEHLIGERSIPDIAGIVVGARILRCTTKTPDIWNNPDVKIELKAEASFDDGKTWMDGGGIGAQGGIHITRGGIEAPYSIYRVNLPDGINRKVRGKIIITGGSAKTSVDLFYGIA